jgi:hypothetical protein
MLDDLSKIAEIDVVVDAQGPVENGVDVCQLGGELRVEGFDPSCLRLCMQALSFPYRPYSRGGVSTGCGCLCSLRGGVSPLSLSLVC